MIGSDNPVYSYILSYYNSNMCIKMLVLNVVNLIISIIVYKTIYVIFGYSLMTAY